MHAVWQVLSGARNDLFDQKFVDIVYVVLLAVGQHLFYLAFNFGMVWCVSGCVCFVGRGAGVAGRASCRSGPWQHPPCTVPSLLSLHCFVWLALAPRPQLRE